MILKLDVKQVADCVFVLAAGSDAGAVAQLQHKRPSQHWMYRNNPSCINQMPAMNAQEAMGA